MATKLATYDFTKPSNLTGSDRRTYPWDEWFDGSIWKIEHGSDFEAHPLMMERIIRTRATAKGAKVKIKHEPMNGDVCGIIILRRADIDQPKPPRKAAAKKAAAPAKAPAKKVASAPAKKVAAKKVATRATAKKVAAPAKKVSKKVSK